MRSHQVILREISKNNLDPKVAHVVNDGKLVPKHLIDNNDNQVKEEILNQKQPVPVKTALVYLTSDIKNDKDDVSVTNESNSLETKLSTDSDETTKEVNSKNSKVENDNKSKKKKSKKKVS